jgi:beta-mannosidase
MSTFEMKKDSSHAFGQSRREFVRLASATIAVAALPTEAAPVGRASRVATTSEGSVTEAEPRKAYRTFDLCGVWSVVALPLSEEGVSGYETFKQPERKEVAALVPGEIHLDLMRAGLMEDPNVGNNARTKCRWPEQHSWWYRTVFELTPDFREHWIQNLVFEGIDLFAQIFVNGKLVCSYKDAFSKIVVDVKEFIRDGDNELVVRVTSGMELPPPFKYENDHRDIPWKLNNPERSFITVKHRFLRKSAYNTYGWDSCDALPNIGIWRGVRLEGRSYLAIEHIRLDTTIGGGEVSLTGEILLQNLHPWSGISCHLELDLQPPHGERIVQDIPLTVQPGRAAVPCRIVVPDAQLWWPNGMGGQPLYTLIARVVCDAGEADRQRQTIGLRTIELKRTRLKEGSRFCFEVNGEEVYCKGGGWAPPDLIPARVTRLTYEKLVEDARRANFNMVRVNGFSYYEADDFYDACDRNGILVWQDFPFTLFLYPDNDESFVELVRGEAKSAIMRLRHHPSLALWCGNNECAWMMEDFWKKVDSRTKQDFGGAAIYNEVLPELCHNFDPSRPYVPSSPIGGSTPNGETDGDRHGPYGLSMLGGDGAENSEEKKTLLKERNWQTLVDMYRARFVSEFGSIGPPTIRSVKEYLAPADLSVNSAAWRIHTNSFDGVGGSVASGIAYHYGSPESLSVDRFILYGQMYQAQHLGAFMEAMRFRKNDPDHICDGVINWCFNDTWGEVGWSIVDHYLRRKASYYWCKRASTPIKVLIRSRDEHLVVRIVNDTRSAHEGEVQYGWVRIDGSAREMNSRSFHSAGNSMLEIDEVPPFEVEARDPREWIYAAVMSGKNAPRDQALWLLAPFRQLKLSTPSISAEVRDRTLVVTSSVYCHGVYLDDAGQEVLEDNYFDLLPGVPKHIAITSPTVHSSYSLRAVLPIGL